MWSNSEIAICCCASVVPRFLERNGATLTVFDEAVEVKDTRAWSNNDIFGKYKILWPAFIFSLLLVQRNYRPQPRRFFF